MNYKDFIESVQIDKGYAMLMSTNSFVMGDVVLQDGKAVFDDVLDKHLNDKELDKLLELRIFNQDSEYRISRGAAFESFIYAVNDDKRGIHSYNEKSGDKCEYFDEKQYLDIDTKSMDDKTKNLAENECVTTGGGRYRLPKGVLSQEDRDSLAVVIRKYVNYEKETGQAYIADWRLVGFDHIEEVK